MKDKAVYAAEWLRKANNDLMAARAVLESEYTITDIPCFHAQQCVEKAFKGFLTLHSVSVKKTHDLMVLLQEVSAIDSDFLDTKETCAQLCDFAVDIRYPGGGVGEPPKEEAISFVISAADILNRIRARMPQ